MQASAPSNGDGTDAGAAAACLELVQSVMSAPEGTPLVVECATCSDADRVLAEGIGCVSGSVATTAGGVSCLTFSREDGRLEEVSCLNHCLHL